MESLYEFMIEWKLLLISLGTVVWLSIGFFLFVKIFVMGLIGCTSNSDNLFVFVYTVGCVLFWPAYLVWMFVEFTPIPKRKKEDTGPYIQYRDRQDGTIINYVGTAYWIDADNINSTYRHVTDAAGMGGEPVKFFINEIDYLYCYTGSNDYGLLVVFKEQHSEQTRIATSTQFDSTFEQI